MNNNLTLLLLVVGILISCFCTTLASASFQIGLEPKVKLCLATEATADPNTVTVRYIVHSPATSPGKIEAHINPPHAKFSGTLQVEQLKLGGQEDSFIFKTTVSGRWEVCLYSHQDIARLEIDIDSSPDLDFRDPTVTPADYGVLSDKLMPLFEKAEYELNYLSQRSAEFERTTQSTKFRVVLFTILEFVLVVGAVGWQIWSLRRFFKEKKVV